MPEHLILIRSAATDYDVQGRIRGTLDIPLCAAGIAEAERIGAGLAGRGIDAVHAAASACAVETGRIVAPPAGCRCSASHGCEISTRACGRGC